MVRPMLQERLAADPGRAIDDVAREEGVTARAVIEALPEAMRYFGEGGFFADAMEAIGRWGEVTLVLHATDGNRQAVGPVPEARIARGLYNLSSRLGSAGAVQSEICAGIAFVERPVSGQPSASVVFLDAAGAIMFEVHVAHDAQGALQKEQHAAFRALREAIVAEHIDD